MTQHTIAVACPVCEGRCSVPDEAGIDRVCYYCNGMGALRENAAAPACDVLTREMEIPPEVPRELD